MNNRFTSHYSSNIFLFQNIISSLLLQCGQRISEISEISLEANPSDITSSKLDEFIDCGINRVSLGIQVSLQKKKKKSQIHKVFITDILVK